MRYLPLFFDLAGRRCLVVGGDAVAARKIRLLLRADARVELIADRLCAEVAAWVERGQVQRLDTGVSADALQGLALVVVAALDQVPGIERAAKVAGVPINVVDRPEISSVVMPGIVDRDPVIVAIGSAGSAPVLVRRLREQIEALLPSGLGRLARFAGRFRSAVAAKRPDAETRRRFWEELFDGPIASDVLAGREQTANEATLRLLNCKTEPRGPGLVSLVGVGPGDPDLLTVKALRRLQDASLVVHDALIGPGILECVRRDAERIDVGKRKGAHGCSQAEIHEILRREAQAGRHVVRLKGGDPFLFGRGGEELLFLRAAGIPVEVVPGITAALGAAATAEIPLTHRGLAQACTLLTGHASDGEPDLDPAQLAAGGTLAIYMGLSVAERLAQRIMAAGRPGATPVAVIERASWPDQRDHYGRLDELGALIRREAVTGPALLIVGEVTAIGREAARKIAPAQAIPVSIGAAQ
ncbi:MAG: siroheme synthase CysG [Rhodospirillales bacterium]